MVRKKMECRVNEEEIKQNKPSKAYCRITYKDKDGSMIETARKDMMVNPSSGSILNTLNISGESPEDIKALNQVTSATFAQQLEQSNVEQ